MTMDFEMIRRKYAELPELIEAGRRLMGRPLTLTEKILLAHLSGELTEPPVRKQTYVDFNPDRVAMQDATAQMAILQFMLAGRDDTAVPTTIHADHLIRSQFGVLRDLPIACFSGIAVPESFERFLRQLGSRILHKEHFIDHHRFSAYELDQLYSKAAAAGATHMITTEKDAARLDLDFVPPIETWYLRLEIEIYEGTEDFEQAINRICFPKSDRLGPQSRS